MLFFSPSRSHLAASSRTAASHRRAAVPRQSTSHCPMPALALLSPCRQPVRCRLCSVHRLGHTYLLVVRPKEIFPHSHLAWLPRSSLCSERNAASALAAVVVSRLFLRWSDGAKPVALPPSSRRSHQAEEPRIPFNGATWVASSTARSPSPSIGNPRPHVCASTGESPPSSRCGCLHADRCLRPRLDAIETSVSSPSFLCYSPTPSSGTSTCCLSRHCRHTSSFF
jgi:hypothetical protein